MSQEAEPGPTASKKFGLEAVHSAVQTPAIVLAGAWGVYTFVYEAKMAPGLAPPSVSVTSTLERVGQKDGMVAIRSTVTRTNVGQAEVRVLELTYNIVGVRVRFGEAAAASAGAMPEELPASSTVAQARHNDEPEGGEVILRHGGLFAGATALPSEPSALNPGEAVSRDLVFYADPARFDSIRLATLGADGGSARVKPKTSSISQMRWSSSCEGSSVPPIGHSASWVAVVRCAALGVSDEGWSSPAPSCSAASRAVCLSAAIRGALSWSVPRFGCHRG